MDTAARVRAVHRIFTTSGEAGACGSLYNLCADPRLNHEIEVVAGVEAAACGEILTAFFTTKRLR